MTLLLLLSLLSLLCCGQVEAQINPALPFREYLDPGQLVSLSWGFDVQQDLITFELSIGTMGWVGLGFSDNGGMAGSDIVIGGVFPNGSQYFKDRYATGNTLPLVDPQQDYTLLSLSERDGKTVMAFNRSIGACDSRDFPITTLPIKLIYAYGLNDEITHHSGRRGTKEISLLGYVPRSTPTTTNHFDITANNFTVPPVHTYYYCRIIKAPNLGRKNHIYQIEPIVDHVDLTHHMLLYGCSASVNQTLEGMCYSNNMSPFNFCFKVIAAWGIGGGSFYLPPNTGISIGGTNDPAYYRLEMHYNNPSQAQGQVDNSGLRFHYTPELFDHDVGTLHIGLDLIPEYMLPPDTQSFRSYAVCNTSIFSKVLPGSFPDMNVFAVLLHTHLAGRKMRVAQFRNGEQIGFLGVNENYDFNLQEFKYLGQTAIIKEGDEMVVECTYNTKNRSKVTNLGLSTTEEMCYAFLLYYPATDISFCWSVPNMTQVGASLQATNKVAAGANLMTMTWNESSVQSYQNLLHNVSQVVFVGSTVHGFAAQTGFVRDIKANPSLSCKASSSEAGSTVSTHGKAKWTQATLLSLLLLWLAVLH